MLIYAIACDTQHLWGYCCTNIIREWMYYILICHKQSICFQPSFSSSGSINGQSSGGVRWYSISSAGVTRKAQQSLSRVVSVISAPGSRKILRTVLYSTSERRDKRVILICFSLAISSM